MVRRSRSLNTTEEYVSRGPGKTDRTEGSGSGNVC